MFVMAVQFQNFSFGLCFNYLPTFYAYFRVRCTAKYVDNQWFSLAALSVWPVTSEQPALHPCKTFVFSSLIKCSENCLSFGQLALFRNYPSSISNDLVRQFKVVCLFLSFRLGGKTVPLLRLELYEHPKGRPT